MFYVFENVFLKMLKLFVIVIIEFKRYPNAYFILATFKIWKYQWVYSSRLLLMSVEQNIRRKFAF